MATRRLLVFFDGTWNTPDSGSKPTNVVKLLRAVCARDGDISQFVFYDKGVGTGGFTDKIAGGASGKGLTDNVVDGYRFLGNNFDSDDEIFIFGFSRGAYTARSLAGLLGLAGVLQPPHLGKDLMDVMAVYRNHELDRAAKEKKIAAMNLGRYSDVKIRCIGVWDTVGSLGVPGDLGRNLLSDRFKFHDVQLSTKVQVALHAVAIDEKRSEFSPTLWVRPEDEVAPPDQIVEQVWFAGVHSNVGGSYEDARLSDIALDWMVKRVRKHTGLRFDEEHLAKNCQPYVQGTGYESRTALYAGSKAYPYQRLIQQTIPKGSGFGEWFRTRFESWDRRSIVPKGLKTINEMLHVSALERWKLPSVAHDAAGNSGDKQQPYRPVNLAAVVEKKNIPVVGWDGERLQEDVSWP